MRELKKERAGFGDSSSGFQQGERGGRVRPRDVLPRDTTQ